MSSTVLTRPKTKATKRLLARMTAGTATVEDLLTLPADQRVLAAEECIKSLDNAITGADETLDKLDAVREVRQRWIERRQRVQEILGGSHGDS